MKHEAYDQINNIILLVKFQKKNKNKNKKQIFFLI